MQTYELGKIRPLAYFMTRLRRPSWLLLALLVLGGCASRPINPSIAQVDLARGYRYQTRQDHLRETDKQTLVILAFSGGGTRAAAFSYGVLEALRRTEVVGPKGKKIRMLDEVDVITGVSGGSFTALAYGLYGDKLFDVYEASFLKRNIQGEIIGRILSPANWDEFWSKNWGRSEVAAKLYDEILFHGATFADLDRGNGPLIVTTATDISTGRGLTFEQSVFDYLCSDLDAVPLSRAAAASSAVPLVLSSVTFNNYGGSCKFVAPQWTQAFSDPETAPRPAARAVKRLQELEAYQDGVQKPYIHLVDGGLADNLGMRGVLETLEQLEALRLVGQPTPLDHLRRIVVFVVNSLSSPKNNWDKSARPPHQLEIMLKAAGVPIDHTSSAAVEYLRDTMARWRNMRRIRDSAVFARNEDPELAQLVNVPNIDLYAIDVSFSALKDKAEFDYLNELPTSFVLRPEAVDRLRAAAGTIIFSSPEFKRLLKDSDLDLVTDTPTAERARN
jgi:NTE family protein